MGLLKSRKDAAKSFERYVDAVEHPPELDDYVEEDELSDQDLLPVTAPQVLSVEELQAQVAARNARIDAATSTAVGGDGRWELRPTRRRPTSPRRPTVDRKRLGEVLVERGLLDAGPARRGARRAGRLWQATR